MLGSDGTKTTKSLTAADTLYAAPLPLTGLGGLSLSPWRSMGLTGRLSGYCSPSRAMFRPRAIPDTSPNGLKHPLSAPSVQTLAETIPTGVWTLWGHYRRSGDMGRCCCMYREGETMVEGSQVGQFNRGERARDATPCIAPVLSTRLQPP